MTVFRIDEKIITIENFLEAVTEEFMQPYLPLVGLTPERLQENRKLLDDCKQARFKGDQAVAWSQNATKFKQLELKKLQFDITKVLLLFRTFDPNFEKLAELGMKKNVDPTPRFTETQAETQAEIEAESQEESKRKSKFMRPRNEAPVRLFWGQFFDNLDSIDATLLAKLDQNGWGMERLLKLKAIFDDYVSACNEQARLLRAGRRSRRKGILSRKAVFSWYRTTSKLLRHEAAGTEDEDEMKIAAPSLSK